MEHSHSSETQEEHKEENKHKTKYKWLNGYTIALIAIIVITIVLRSKFMLQPSLWVDETHYMVYGAKLIGNPLGVFSKALINNVQFPAIIVAFFSLFTTAFVAGRIMDLVFVLIGVMATYGIGKELGHKYAGLLSAVLLAFNPLHWFIGSRALVDVPVASMIALFIYTLIRWSKLRSRNSFIWMIVVGVLTIFTKLPGLIVIVIFLVYYSYLHFLAPLYDKHIKKGGKNYWVYGILMLLILAVIWQWNSLKAATVFRMDFINLIPFAIGGGVISGFLALTIIITILFVIFGVWYRKHEYLILPMSFLLLTLFFSFNPGDINPRYLLPIVTPIYLMLTILVMEIVVLAASLAEKNVRSKVLHAASIIAVLVLFFLIAPKFYAAGNSLILDKYYSYTDYDKAGEWLKVNAEEDALINVMSTSWAVLYTQRETIHLGGTIANNAQFKTPDDLLKLVNSTDMPVYVVFDIWESWAQPRWLTEWMQGNKWGENGFDVVHAVNVKYTTDKQQIAQNYKFFSQVPTTGTEETPGIFIFKYRGKNEAAE